MNPIKSQRDISMASFGNSKNYFFSNPIPNYENTFLDCDKNYESFKDELIILTSGNIYNDNLKTLTEHCKHYDIFRKDISQLYVDLIYRFQKIMIGYEASKGDYNTIKEILSHKGYLQDTNTLILALFRPIQIFITDNINISGMNQANRTYGDFNYIYLVLNILTDISLCFVVYYYILRRLAVVNRNYFIIIDVLKL